MYPTYPSGPSPDNPALAPVRPDRPGGVTLAVVLMYVGAALSAILGIILVAFVSIVRKDLNPAKVNLTPTQLDRGADGLIVLFAIIGLIVVGLWIWMAWANGAGKNWARILSTVLFGIFTVIVLLGAASPHPFPGLLPFGLVWLIGLVTIVLIWRRESGLYFNLR